MKTDEVKRLLAYAKKLRQPHEQEIKDAYKYTYPAKEFMRERNTTPDRTSIYDSTAGSAVRNLVTNTIRLLIPQTEPWADIVFRTETLRKQYGVQLADKVQKSNQKLFDHFTQSNFYLATNNALIDSVVAGTMAMMIIDHPGKPLSYMAIPVDEIYFLEDHNDTVNVVFREHQMEARNIVTRFTDAPQSIKDLATEQPEKTHKIIEVCYPDGVGYKYEVYKSTGFELIHSAKTAMNPFIVSRWEKSLGNVWGESWVRAALPAIRSANGLVRNIEQFGEYAAFGLWQTTGEFPTEQVEGHLAAGSILMVDEPLQPVGFPGQFNLSFTMVEGERAQIKSMLHDTSLPNDEALKYMTAEAVIQRRSEFMRLVGEPAQRLQREYLQKIADQTVHRLQQRGELIILTPDEIVSLQAKGIEKQSDIFRVDVNAAVQRANRMADTLDSINAFTQMSNIVGPQQMALHADLDKFTREGLLGAGFRADWLRTETQVKEIKKLKAQQQQMEQALAAAQNAGESLGQTSQPDQNQDPNQNIL